MSYRVYIRHDTLKKYAKRITHLIFHCDFQNTFCYGDNATVSILMSGYFKRKVPFPPIRSYQFLQLIIFLFASTYAVFVSSVFGTAVSLNGSRNRWPKQVQEQTLLIFS
jgi:hypothetical protein